MQSCQVLKQQMLMATVVTRIRRRNSMFLINRSLRWTSHLAILHTLAVSAARFLARSMLKSQCQLHKARSDRDLSGWLYPGHEKSDTRRMDPLHRRAEASPMDRCCLADVPADSDNNSNDIAVTHGLLTPGTTNPLPMDQKEAILWLQQADFLGQLKQQYYLGARKFLTILVPREYRSESCEALADWTAIARAPQYLDANHNLNQELLNLTTYWNNVMQGTMKNFQNEWPDAQVAIYDPTNLFNYILDAWQGSGAPNNYCSVYYDGNPKCLWWDGIHPYTLMSGFLNSSIYDSLVTAKFI
ncbi:hypothetical protein MRB53_039891 [Persea americana]|nr:hypothetical protein MRB53_039891 [Persea americana]